MLPKGQAYQKYSKAGKQQNQARRHKNLQRIKIQYCTDNYLHKIYCVLYGMNFGLSLAFKVIDIKIVNAVTVGHKRDGTRSGKGKTLGYDVEKLLDYIFSHNTKTGVDIAYLFVHQVTCKFSEKPLSRLCG